MTLPEQLRAIADRIEAAENDLLVAQADLWRLAGALPGDVVDLAADPSLLNLDGSSIEPDSAAVQVAAGAGVEDGGRTAAVPPLRLSRRSRAHPRGLPGLTHPYRRLRLIASAPTVHGHSQDRTAYRSIGPERTARTGAPGQ